MLGEEISFSLFVFVFFFKYWKIYFARKKKVTKIKEGREMNPLVERGNPCETWIFINSCRSNDSFRSERFEELGISNGNISVFSFIKILFFFWKKRKKEKGAERRKREKKRKKHTPVKFIFFLVVKKNCFLVVIYCIHLSQMRVRDNNV